MATQAATILPRLFLIRHGDTDWTDSHQHTGYTDISLNASGEEHARRMGVRLQGETFTRVFTSPLIRARRTCQLAGFADRAELNSDLIEWDYGDYEGRMTVDILRERPDWNLFRDGAPNGESPEQVAARADRFVQLVRPIGGDVAAFSSGHIIRMIAARWLGLPPLAAKYFFTATASVGIFGYEHSQNQPVVLLWNDVRPLVQNSEGSP
jgi:probable phosphoglycerate mutase